MVCRGCGKTVSELPDGNLCEECIIFEQECAAQEQEGDKMVQVTREMAIDAGDRSLEGQWIRW